MPRCRPRCGPLAGNEPARRFTVKVITTDGEPEVERVQMHRVVRDRNVERHQDALHAAQASRSAYVPPPMPPEDPVQRGLRLRSMQRDWSVLRRRYGDVAQYWELVGAERKEEGRANDRL